MEKKNTAGNAIGIVFAWLLSIILVVVLLVTPMLLSAISLLNANTITKAVTDTLVESLTPEKEKASVPSYSVNKLSETAGEEKNAKNALGGALEEVFGEDVSPELLEKILSSKAAKELIGTYVEDVTNAFTGSDKAPKLDAEKLKAIVKDNIDDVVAIVKEIDPNVSEHDLTELKDALTKVIDEKAGELVDALPKPTEIRQAVMEDIPEMEVVFNLLAKKNVIILALIALPVVLCGLIFLCRMSGFRGLRWIAVDLFVGGGLNAFICGGLLVASSVLLETVADQAVIGALVSSLLSSFTTGMLVSTAVILVVGGASLATYIVIRKLSAKKAEAK